MAQRSKELSNVRVFAAASAVTVTVIAWGILVFTAIDFGRTARGGSTRDWVYLLLATLGAVACMFGAIVMAAQLHRLTHRSPTSPLPLPLDGPLLAPDQPEAAPQPVLTTPSPVPVPTPVPAPVDVSSDGDVWPVAVRSGAVSSPVPVADRGRPGATYAGKRAARG